jgi:hypothetical protein
MFGRYLVVDLVAPNRRGRDREKIAVRRPVRHFLAELGVGVVPATA